MARAERGLNTMVARSSSISRKRDGRSVIFLGCDAYMALVEKNPKETFSIEQQ
jgi:hypothetical protein